MECIHLDQNSLVAGSCKHGNELRATVNNGEINLLLSSGYTEFLREQGPDACCDGTGTVAEHHRYPDGNRETDHDGPSEVTILNYYDAIQHFNAPFEERRQTNIISPVPRICIFPPSVVPGKRPALCLLHPYPREISVDNQLSGSRRTCTALFASPSQSNLLTFYKTLHSQKKVLLRSIQTSAFMWQQTEDIGCPRTQVHQSVPSGRIGKEIGKVWPETLVIHQMERPISAP